MIVPEMAPMRTKEADCSRAQTGAQLEQELEMRV